MASAAFDARPARLADAANTYGTALAMNFALFRLALELPILTDWPMADRFTVMMAIMLPSVLALTETMLSWRSTFSGQRAARVSERERQNATL